MLNGFSIGSGFGLMGSVIPIIVAVIFVVVIGSLAVTLVKGLTQWNKNNHSPKLTVDAKIVSRRADVSHHHHAGNQGAAPHTTTSTTYYVTFQVESGDRMELRVSGQEYGYLAEGDAGKLTFQGTRYLSFERL